MIEASRLSVRPPDMDLSGRSSTLSSPRYGLTLGEMQNEAIISDGAYLSADLRLA